MNCFAEMQVSNIRLQLVSSQAIKMNENILFYIFLSSNYKLTALNLKFGSIKVSMMNCVDVTNVDEFNFVAMSINVFVNRSIPILLYFFKREWERVKKTNNKQTTNICQFVFTMKLPWEFSAKRDPLPNSINRSNEQYRRFSLLLNSIF